MWRRHQERMPQLCRSTKHHASCLTLFLVLLAAGSLQAVMAEGKHSLPCTSAALLCRSLPFLRLQSKARALVLELHRSLRGAPGWLSSCPALLRGASSWPCPRASLPSSASRRPAAQHLFRNFVTPGHLMEFDEHQIVMQICQSRSHVVRGARSCTRHQEDASIGVHVLAPVCSGTRARIVRGARSCTSVLMHTHTLFGVHDLAPGIRRMPRWGCTFLHQCA